MEARDCGGLRYVEMSQHPRERPSPDLLLTTLTKLFLMTLHGCMSLAIIQHFGTQDITLRQMHSHDYRSSCFTVVPKVRAGTVPFSSTPRKPRKARLGPSCSHGASGNGSGWGCSQAKRNWQIANAPRL